MTNSLLFTIGELKQLVGEDKLAGILSETIAREKPVSSSEVRSWRESIPALLSVIDSKEFDDLICLLEYNVPNGNERIDLILFGGRPGDKHAIVVELKQWSEMEFQEYTAGFIVPGIGLQRNPTHQLELYLNKIEYYHSESAQYKFSGIVFMHNISNQRLESYSKLGWFTDTDLRSIYTRDDKEALRELIRETLFPLSVTKEGVKKFVSGKYAQNPKLFKFINENYESIQQIALEKLASQGFGLTVEQQIIFEEVLQLTKQGQDATYLVSGEPGSGKTLIAIFLLIASLNKGFNTGLAVRNSRIHAVLKRLFKGKNGIGQSMPVYYFDPRGSIGVGSPTFQAHFDLLIVDESQRMESKIIETVLSNASVKVILLDEGQRLNPPESGTLENFSNAARKRGDQIFQRGLESSIRCVGGSEYSDFVEKFISGQILEIPNIISSNEFHSDYEISVFSTIEELLSWLRSKNNSKTRIVASFTESSGDIKKLDSPNNIRVGKSLQSGFSLYSDSDTKITWLMNEAEYNKFWTSDDNGHLDRAASIYGSQGFEADYVGIIWGRDYVLNDCRWTLGDPNYCFDTIDGLVRGRKNKTWSSEALELLKNRYRIFMTRGILGTGIFFEDEKTRTLFTQETEYFQGQT